LPDVVRADIDTSTFCSRQTPYMPKVDDIPSCPEICEPESEWITSVISKFSDLRTVCNNIYSKFREFPCLHYMQLLGYYSTFDKAQERRLPVPPMREEAAWHKFCLGSDLEISDSAASLSNDSDGMQVINHLITASVLS